MTAADAVWFRTQRVATQHTRATACLIAATLSVMAAHTRGATGPAITLDGFRAAQADKVGGIDLYDAKAAAAHYGVAMEVWANYGPGPEYPADERAALLDHPATTPAAVVAMLEQGRHVTISVDYGALPPAWRRAPYAGPHGMALLGTRIDGGVVQVLLGDPLDTQARWVAWAPVATAAVALSGAAGRVCVSATPVRQPLRRVRVLPGAIWVYTRSGPAWTRVRQITGGFSADCTAVATLPVMGRVRPMVHLESGSREGAWLDTAAWNVRYSEVP